ncbi:hypothetical protein Ciccas_001646 [Cichlidogyrus casuarinus]|uniref:C2H2-type domain-containing protein n=1 Tax=Cichlidogyrus casuarinus TaxID=1844966 RepID=A0ABD2QJS4_9PLAT
MNVALPQRMQRRGERAYFMDEEEPIKSENFQRIVRVNGAETPMPKEPQKPVHLSKAEFPSLDTQQAKTSKKHKKTQKKKEEAPESNSTSKHVDPEAQSLAKVQYFVCPDFAERTEKLVNNLKCFFDDCGSTKSAFTTYTEISKQYLNGNLNAEAYLSLLKGLQDDIKVSGSEKWEKIRVEAIAESINLLPNVARQRSLLRTLKESVGNAPWFIQVADLLCICKTCKQVCLKHESKKHHQEAAHCN